MLDAFAGFDVKMAELADTFSVIAGLMPHRVLAKVQALSTQWCHQPTYILMNFAGKSRDVMTLAHEMGRVIRHWRLVGVFNV